MKTGHGTWKWVGMAGALIAAVWWILSGTVERARSDGPPRPRVEAEEPQPNVSKSARPAVPIEGAGAARAQVIQEPDGVETPASQAPEQDGLAGVVIDEEGRPVKGASVTGISKATSSGLASLSKQVLTDGQGRFSLPEVTENVLAIHDDFIPRSVDVAAADRLRIEIVLKRGAEFLVEVVGEDEPLDGANVRVYAGDSPGEGLFIGTDAERERLDQMFFASGGTALSRSGATNSRGKATFRGLEAASYFVTASAVGFVQEDVPNAVVLDGRQARSLTIRLVAGGTLSGRVANQFGAPLEGATVMGYWDGILCRGTTKADGSFLIGGWPAYSGVGELSVSHPDQASLWKRCSLEEAGGYVSLDEHTLELTLLDSFGAPIQEAVLVTAAVPSGAILATGWEKSLEPEPGGVVRMERLSRALETLRLETNGYLPAWIQLGPGEVDWTGVAYDTIRFDPGDNVVPVEVLDPRGRRILEGVKFFLVGESLTDTGARLVNTRSMQLPAGEEGLFQLPIGYLSLKQEMRLSAEFEGMRSLASVVVKSEAGEIAEGIIQVQLVNR